MNLKELRELRESKRKELGGRGGGGSRVQIIVGMGTCGVAAGAQQTLAAFLDEMGRHNNLQDVVVKQTGCMGLCHAEPTVEVVMAGMPPTIYGRVDEEVARDIVRKHLLGGMLVNHHVFDRPAADIVDVRAALGGK
jgi:NADP-reducing hydrogenase subunit HndB